MSQQQPAEVYTFLIPSIALEYSKYSDDDMGDLHQVPFCTLMRMLSSFMLWVCSWLDVHTRMVHGREVKMGKLVGRELRLLVGRVYTLIGICSSPPMYNVFCDAVTPLPGSDKNTGAHHVGEGSSVDSFAHTA